LKFPENVKNSLRNALHYQTGSVSRIDIRLRGHALGKIQLPHKGEEDRELGLRE